MCCFLCLNAPWEGGESCDGCDGCAAEFMAYLDFLLVLTHNRGMIPKEGQFDDNSDARLFNDPDHDWHTRVTGQFNDLNGLHWDSSFGERQHVLNIKKKREAEGIYQFAPSAEVPVHRGLYSTQLDSVSQDKLGNHWTTDEEIAHHAASGSFDRDAMAHPAKHNVILQGTVHPKNSVEVRADDNDEWFNHRGVTPDSGEEEVTVPSGRKVNKVSAIQYGRAKVNRMTDEITPGKIERAVYLGKRKA